MQFSISLTCFTTSLVDTADVDDDDVGSNRFMMAFMATLCREKRFPGTALPSTALTAALLSVVLGDSL